DGRESGSTESNGADHASDAAPSAPSRAARARARTAGGRAGGRAGRGGMKALRAVRGKEAPPRARGGHLPPGKTETPSPQQIQSPKSQIPNAQPGGFGPWHFGFGICFGFRIWDFGFPPQWADAPGSPAASTHRDNTKRNRAARANSPSTPTPAQHSQPKRSH